VRMSLRARCWVLRDRAGLRVDRDFWTLSYFLLVGECAGYRPYFENYTVDASILDTDLRVRVYIIDLRKTFGSSQNPLVNFFRL